MAGWSQRRGSDRSGQTGRAHTSSSLTLDKGYDEQVGEGGNLLSVGQKQLISLARAVLAKPDIFIMDEATSSVDTLTEALIQRGMEALMQGRTSFVIAHRLSTIKRANRILVHRATAGSRRWAPTRELLRARGHYYRLYTKQFREQMVIDDNFMANWSVSRLWAGIKIVGAQHAVPLHIHQYQSRRILRTVRQISDQSTWGHSPHIQRSVMFIKRPVCLTAAAMAAHCAADVYQSA